MKSKIEQFQAEPFSNRYHYVMCLCIYLLDRERVTFVDTMQLYHIPWFMNFI